MREVTYTLEKSDYLALMQAAMKHMPQYGSSLRRGDRQIRDAVAVFGMYAVFAGLAAWRMIQHNEIILGLMLVAVAIVQVTILWRMRSPRWQQKAAIKRVKAAIARGDVGGIEGGYTLRISEKGIAVDASEYQATYLWRRVDRLVCEPDGIFAYFRSGQAQMIPARAFPDQQAMKDFAAEAEGYLAAAGGSAAARVGEFIAERDALCPACGYNLRGLPTDRCPECGELIDLNELKQKPKRPKP